MTELCYNKLRSAGVAHPVERHLAKVEVASSSLVTRSMFEKYGTLLSAVFLYMPIMCLTSRYLMFKSNYSNFCLKIKQS